MDEKLSKRVARRNLLKGAAVSAAGAAAAAIGGSAMAEDAPEWDCDILVVGAGSAGTEAATRASELGVKVILIEKMEHGWWAPGGSLVISGQMYHIAMLPIGFPEEQLMAACKAVTLGRTPQPVLDALVGNAHRAVEWMKSNGVEFEGEPGKEMILKPGKTRDVVYGSGTMWAFVKPGGPDDAANLGGKINMERLYAKFEENGGTGLFETKAVSLLQNDKGEVVGVRAQHKDGLFDIRAKSVIITTGGFTFNKEMMEQFYGPQGSEIIGYCSPGATGDGHLMAMAVGAQRQAQSLTNGCRPVPEKTVWNPDPRYLNLGPLGQRGIVLDEYGDRIWDESLTPEATVWQTMAIKHRQSLTGMMVFDQALYDSDDKVKMITDMVEEYGGTVYKADTIEELVTVAQEDGELGLRIGRQQSLMATVAEFNAAIEDGTNLTKLRPPRKDFLSPITTPPFYGVPFTTMNIACFGGLMTNEKAQVLDRDGKVIPGLYAAGEASSVSGGVGPINTHFHGGNYTGLLSGGLVFGMLAAEDAAARAETIE